ncbi:MAG: MFS transporter [Rikenellaceae bacterium]
MDKFEQQKRLGIFFSLYIAQSIPMSFFSTVIPVLMRQENFSMTTITLLQLIKVPWLIKFFWSPLVDRNTDSLRSYKKWIFSSELCYAALIVGVSILDIKTDMILIAVLILLSFIASATQDIATDALAVRSFDRKNKSMVNSMQSMGSFAGTLVGSGVLLLIYKNVGWGIVLPCLAVFVMLAIIPLMLQKRDTPLIAKHTKANKGDLISFFKQKGISKQIIYLVLSYSGLIGILSTLRPYMVDLGYTITEIGLISGIIGTGCGFVASYFGGRIIKKYGRYRSRIIFSVAALATASYFLIFSLFKDCGHAIYLGVCFLWASYGLSTVVVYTTSMDKSREGREGTDFTIQTVITHLSSMIIAIFSGKLIDSFGITTLYSVEVLLTIVTLVFSIFAFRVKRRR